MTNGFSQQPSGHSSPPASRDLSLNQGGIHPFSPSQWEITARMMAGILEALPIPSVLLLENGDLFMANETWRIFAKNWNLPEEATEEVPGWPGVERWIDPGSKASLYLHFLSEIFGEDRVSFEEVKRACVEGKETFCKTFPLVCRGRRLWMRFRVAPVETQKQPYTLGSLSATPPLHQEPRILMVTHEDVTQQFRIEKDLKESHSLFQQAIESVQDGIFLYDKEGRFVMVNSAFAAALGLTVHEMTGRSYHEIFKPELARIVQEQILIVQTSGQTLSFEIVLETPSGPKNVHISKGVYRNHRNDVVGIFGIARDITEWKQVREKLEKSALHFKALIENSGDRVALILPSGRIRYASPSSRAILGFDHDELLNGDFFQRVHPEDVATFKKVFNQLLATGGAVTHEYRAFHKDGHWVWMEARLTHMVDDPSVAAVVINERDISERKNAENDLGRYEDIVKSSHEAVVSTDLEGNITTWNPAAERIFGYSRSEILGRSFSELVSEGDALEHENIRASVLKGRRAREFEWVMKGKGDQAIDASLKFTPLRSREGKIRGILKIISDISERRCLEREILEISDREKERIGQDLHDDLCQHLIGITLVSDRLAKSLEEAASPHCDEIRGLTELIRQAVDHARRLSRGLSLVQLDELGLVAALEQLVQNTEKLFRAPCHFECDGPLHIENLEIAKGLYRVAQEALHNAVKHSQATKIVLSLKTTRDSVVISVWDDGVGISETRNRVKEGPESGGFGMHGMQYRAKAIGAALDFRRNREGGTTVQCRISKRKCQG